MFRLRLIALPLTAVVAVLAVPAEASALPTGGIQTFIGIQVSPTGPGRVIALGPITATGSDVVVSDTEDIYHFPAGDITVDHQVVSSHQSFNPTTCAFRLTETGTIQIVHGTGRYSGVTGHGTYRVQIFSLGCGNAPTAFAFYLQTHGPISLGG